MSAQTGSDPARKARKETPDQEGCDCDTEICSCCHRERSKETDCREDWLKPFVCVYCRSGKIETQDFAIISGMAVPIQKAIETRAWTESGSWQSQFEQ